MCDSMVNITPTGVMFAKNSDRDPNESQLLEWLPAAEHAPGSRVRCTWIDIPQAATTSAVLISRPWWMWGAEMGANEHGVVIGNEAVFTKEPYGEPGLLGMDLLRLALERTHDVAEATSVIIDLLERHGQGGACSYERPGFTYHNSFLIADRRSAMVLETAGRHYATEEVTHGVRSISNGLTIDGFAESYANRLRGLVAACDVRRARTERSASRADSPAALMTALRDHGECGAPRWALVNGTLHAPCVHAGGLVASSQTTASFVADLRDRPSYWATATAAPCTSLFKPVRVDEPVDLGPAPTNRFDPATLWWRHERLHRSTMADLPGLLPRYRHARDRTEAEWLADPPPSAEAFAAADQLEETWLEDLEGARDRRPRWVQRSWRDLDAAAGVDRAA
ncbi:MAG: peptidase U34 [Acidimicrobiales bacterium]|jgi:secernin